jgi:DNA-binding NtrC family response regulator
MRSAAPRVLVIDDQPKTAQALARLAPELALLETRGDGGSRPHARHWRDVESVLAGSRQPDLAVLDLRFELPDEELLPDLASLGSGPGSRSLRQERQDRQGLFILERLRRRLPDLPVVLTTAYEDIPFEEEALRLRADAFTYAVAEEESGARGLLQAVRRVLAESQAPPTSGRFFWGNTSALRELRRRVGALAATQLPLLVTGPTGTGKNLLVRDVIHPLSGRPGPLVSFDCATVPEGLLSAALFGVVRGAFTGALSDRAGVFEAAREGTLFLDEIENLSLEAQKSLLTAIHEGRVRRLGSAVEIPHSARIVAASNVDLRRSSAGGTFRADLLMRLNPTLALELPPLSERREDLEPLADLSAAAFFQQPAHRLAALSAARAAGAPEPSGGIALVRGGEGPRDRKESVLFLLPRKAWAAMRRHPWPGNIRQFDMVIADVLAASLYGGQGPSIDPDGRAVFTMDARLVFDLLLGAAAPREASEGAWVIPRPSPGPLAGFRRELERAVYRMLFHQAKGDFESLAEILTGSRAAARAVRLRFNRLGLSARGEK